MNRFGSNYYENENEQFPENQRINQQLSDNAEKPWNDSYRHEGYTLHRHSHPPYRPDHTREPYGYLPPHGTQPRNEYFHNRQMPYFPADDPARHHDDKIWTERNFFKDTDYRYRSGHRDQWHRDYDREYDPNYRGDRRQPHDESFLNRIGDGIREGWNNLIHSDREREENQYYDRDRGYTRPQDRMQDRRDNRRFGPEEERERGYTRRESEWKNSGPDHRDEDYIHPTDPRY